MAEGKRSRGGLTRIVDNPVLVEVTRGPAVESRHRGLVAVVDTKGRTVAAIGDTATPIFPRSAVKPIQALPLVESGAADAFGYGPIELALACASHGGEPRHVAAVTEMLAAAGADQFALECGPQWPANEDARIELAREGKTPTALHNNCSGKHAGFIAVARHLGWDVKGYAAPAHPVQELVLRALTEVTGAHLDESVRGVDGCSIPAYAIPPERLALGFARFATGTNLSGNRTATVRRLIEACWAEPFFVAGTGRFCTEAMTVFGERLIVKTGGEGVFCAGFPEQGFGAAIKCEDGAGRAAEVLMAAVIAMVLKPDEAEMERFHHRLHAPVLSRNGVPVGEIRPAPALAGLLAPA
jgi:L-asparaginase II